MFFESLESRKLFSAVPAAATGLVTMYDSDGLSSVAYNGVTLFDSAADTGFVITNYSWLTPAGITQSVQYPQADQTWDSAAQTLTLSAPEIRVTAQFTTSGSTLTMNITITNVSDTDTLLGAGTSPMTLKFPRDPAGFNSNPAVGFGIDGPTAIDADYGSGEFVLTNDDNLGGLYVGLVASNQTKIDHSFPMLVGSSAGGNTGASWPVFNRSLPPMKSETYTVSLRFAASGMDPSIVAPEVYAQFAAAHPSQLQWTDKRPIAGLFLSGDGSGSASNPRGYLNNPKINVSTASGLASFRTKLLAYADASVAIMKSMNAQGMITWDIEGQEFPSVDYIGDPTQLATLAPEMLYAPPGRISTVDAYFGKFTNAGFKVGLTIRPSLLVNNAGEYQQVASIDPIQTIIDKINYAKTRWGCTIFYVDSTDAWATGGAQLARVQKACPGVLLIPENASNASYAYAAPYIDPRHASPVTPPAAVATYSNAFNVISAMDDNLKIDGPALLQAVEQGSILLFHGWYNDPQNALIADIYAQANANSARPAFASTNDTNADDLDLMLKGKHFTGTIAAVLK